MNRYSAYGLIINSAFDLPELPPPEDNESAPEIVVRSGTVEPVPVSDGTDTKRRIHAEPDVCRITYDAYGSARIESGERIIFDPSSPAVLETKGFRRTIESELMAILLHQRGLLVLHASAVALNGTAALFLGNRGAGKSTLASAFYAHGHQVLEDDLVAIRFDSETPAVVPGVPEIRLLPDAIDALDVEETTKPTGDFGPEKRYQQVDVVKDPIPLGGCYILRAGDDVQLEPLNGTNGMLSLIAQTSIRGLLFDTEIAPTHFRQCASLLEKIPFRTLQRPPSHDELPAVITAVRDDLQSYPTVYR